MCVVRGNILGCCFSLLSTLILLDLLSPGNSMNYAWHSRNEAYSGTKLNLHGVIFLLPLHSARYIYLFIYFPLSTTGALF